MSALPTFAVPSLPRPPAAVRRLAPSVALGAGLALGVLMLLPAAFGLQRYVVTGGSMTGTYDRGSLLYEERVPVADLRVGDVITYRPPAGSGPAGLVTHRIVAINREAGGRRVFRTRGDANPAADPWRFTLASAEQARVSFAVPYAGWVFAALARREVRMLVIGLPALLVALGALAGVLRPGRRS